MDLYVHSPIRLRGTTLPLSRFGPFIIMIIGGSVLPPIERNLVVNILSIRLECTAFNLLRLSIRSRMFFTWLPIHWFQDKRPIHVCSIRARRCMPSIECCVGGVTQPIDETLIHKPC
jgi:hypothetical protein